MGRNYRRVYSPEYNKPKNLHRGAAQKNTPHPNSEQPRKVQKPQQTKGRKIPAEPISNPPIAQRLTPFCRSRGEAKELAGQCRRPMITHKEVNLLGALTSRTQGQTRPPRERSVTETNTNGSVWQSDVATVGPPEKKPGGNICHPEATEAAGMRPLPQTQAKAMQGAMTITQAQRSEGNRGPGCRSSRVPARKRSSRVPADPTVRRRGEGRVDPTVCRGNYR